MPPLCFCFDFDGVLCDSAQETGTVGWRAAAQLWPYLGIAAEPATAAARAQQQATLRAFGVCRPVLEVGYEAMLIVRLLVEGHSEAAVLADFAALAAAVLAREPQTTRAVLVAAFGAARDALTAQPAAWIAAHGFYSDGALVQAINTHLVGRGCAVYIITTKQKRFAVELAAAAGLALAPEAVFGLEAGAKASVLQQLQQRHPAAQMHFIEDRLATLEEVRRVHGTRVALHFAEWGYSTAGERAAARRLEEAGVVQCHALRDFWAVFLPGLGAKCSGGQQAAQL